MPRRSRQPVQEEEEEEEEEEGASLEEVAAVAAEMAAEKIEVQTRARESRARPKPDDDLPSADIADRINQIRRSLGNVGAAVGAEVSRETVPDSGEFAYLDYLSSLTNDDIDGIRALIAKRFGGGRFKVRFRVGGTFRQGLADEFLVDRPRRSHEPVEQVEEAPPVAAPPPVAPPAPPSPPALTLSDVMKALDEREAARETRELRARVPALESELAALKARPPVAPTPSEAPEVATLRTQVANLEKSLVEQKDRAVQDQLKAIVERLDRPRKVSNPLKKFTGEMLNVVALKKAMEQLRDDDDGLFSMAEFKRPIRRIIRGFAEKLDGGGESGLGSSAAAAKVGSLQDALTQILMKQELLIDRRFIRALTAAYPREIFEFSTLPNPPAVIAWMKAHLPPELGVKFEQSVTTDDANGTAETKQKDLMLAVEALRNTMLRNAAAPPRVKRVRVHEPEPPEPDDEEEEIDEDAEDEEDEAE